MKDVYINTRLHPLLIAGKEGRPVRIWIFSQGEPWLLLTPDRLGVLAARLGLGDSRVHRLLALVKRHSGRPERFCRRLGVRETRYLRPEEYPLALCPRCDSPHYPHPEDAGTVCPDCREEERKRLGRRPGNGELRDRRQDRAARRRLLEKDPDSFDEGVLWPNFRLNINRRVHRDWDRAVNRVLMGHPYRQVSREIGCSVGLLHRKVQERHWENN